MAASASLNAEGPDGVDLAKKGWEEQLVDFDW